MNIYSEEYKGFLIVVSEIKQAHWTARYLAKASNGSDSAHGESIEDAVRHLKSKIDSINIHKGISTRPLENTELDRLVAFLNSPDGEMRIRHKLQHKHFFTQNDFCEIGLRAIINHTDIIQAEMNKQGNSFQLNLATTTLGNKDFYAIYDMNYFDTPSKISRLENTLFELMQN